MSSNIVIRPKPGSGAVKKMATVSSPMVVHEIVDERGVKSTESGGEFKGERFPNTRSRHRPIYSSQKKRWLLLLDNGNEPDDEWINTMATRCRFRYPEGHRHEGELITKADILDLNDEFFQHGELYVKLEEGYGVMDFKNPVHQVVLAALRADREFAAAGQKVYNSRVRYLFSTPEADEGAISKRLSRKAEAYKLFFAMDIVRKKDVLRILKNKDYVAEPSESILDMELSKFIENDEKTTLSGKSYLEEFIHVASLDGMRMKLKEIVQRGIRRNIIVRQRGQFIFNGKPVASTQGDLEEFFFRADNHEEMDRLQIKLGDIQ